MCRVFKVAPFLFLSFVSTPAYTDELEQGILLHLYDIQQSMNKLYEVVPTEAPNVAEVKAGVAFLDRDSFKAPHPEYFIVHLMALLEIGVTGEYEFELTSDDGSILELNDKKLIDNDGIHGAISKTAKVTLDAGRHSLKIKAFNNEGGAFLTLKWKEPGATEFSYIPREVLFTEKRNFRPVAPGPKRIIRGVTDFRPGYGLPVVDLHPGLREKKFRPAGFEPRVAGLAFKKDKLLVSTWDPRAKAGAIYQLSNVLSGDASAVTTKLIADQLQDPLGIVVAQNRIFVCEKDRILELVEKSDGVFEKQTLVSGWSASRWHQFTFGLLYDGGDYLYAGLSTALDAAKPAPETPERGSIIRVSIRNREWEPIAGGLRTPNGLGWGPGGSMFVSDNQGQYKPSDDLYHVQPGKFFGYFTQNGAFEYLPETKGAVIFPHGKISRSISQPVLIPKGPYRGHMLIGDVTYGGLSRVSLEPVGDTYQGAVYHHSNGYDFEAGVNRLIIGPDDNLYVGGVGDGDSNSLWNWRGKHWGLQRFEFTDQMGFEIFEVRAVQGGFEIIFSKAVSADLIQDSKRYQISQWYYAPTAAYGGPEVDTEALLVQEATSFDEGRRVYLRIPGLKRGRVVELSMPTLKDTSGEPIRGAQCWYTLNRLGSRKLSLSL